MSVVLSRCTKWDRFLVTYPLCFQHRMGRGLVAVCTSVLVPVSKRQKHHENFVSTLALGFKLIDDCTIPPTRFLNDSDSLKLLCSKSHVAQNWASGNEGGASSLILPFC